MDDCLYIDLNDINSNKHIPKRVDSNSLSCPPMLADGVRLYFPIVGSKFVVIIIIGFKTDSDSAVWKNSYNSNAGDWNGWVEL